MLSRKIAPGTPCDALVFFSDNDNMSLGSQRSQTQSTVTGTQSDSEARTQSPDRTTAGSLITHSSQKKKKIKKIVSSDSERYVS